MKLSKKGEYALLALTYLSHNYISGNNKLVQISEIARKEDIPEKFLEGILLTLKKRGILQSQRGIGGGYTMNRPPADITLGEVIRIMDGPLAPIGCASKTAHVYCPAENTCGLQGVMLEVRNAISNVLDNMTFEDMCNRIYRKFKKQKAA